MFGKKRALENKVAELELEKKSTEFEFNKTISQLEKTISELEQQLSAERSVHEADKKTLQELQGRMELENRTYSELQDALRQRIQEFDERTRQHENEMAVERKNWEYEQAQKRVLLEQELEQRRRQEEVAIQKRIQVFSNSYNRYLAQVQQAFGRLNDASAHIGKTFLQQDSDIAGQLDDWLNIPFGNTIVIENTPKDPENFFTLRADAPAEK